MLVQRSVVPVKAEFTVGIKCEKSLHLQKDAKRCEKSGKDAKRTKFYEKTGTSM